MVHLKKQQRSAKLIKRSVVAYQGFVSPFGGTAPYAKDADENTGCIFCVWFLHHIPKEKRVYLICSYMGVTATFILHYAITDPKMKKALLDELKQIKPYKIIK